ncbi:MAG: hypothetical protein Q9170_007339 [Blastenia crenularia]
MPKIEAVLSSVRADGTLHEESNLQFPSSENEDSSPGKLVRYVLRSDDVFQIGEQQYVLQQRQIPSDQEIQVTSSGPKPPPVSRPSTPAPASGLAVIETPMTDRHQPTLITANHTNAQPSSSRSTSPTSSSQNRQTKKRSNTGSLPIVDLDTSVSEPPKKRQRTTASCANKIANESQNSVRSTIHVDVPEMTLDPVSRTERIPEATESTPSDKANGSVTPTKSVEPPSSNRSTRSAAQTQEELSQNNQTLRVYYASSTQVHESTAYTRFLRQHDIKQVKKITDCNILCTGKGELKRTPNLILAVLEGKDIVTEQWISQSAQKGKVLPTRDFLPKAPEQEWGTLLVDAIDRGRRREEPFNGWTINFTPSIKKELGKSWSELKEICLTAGATAVQAMVPKNTEDEMAEFTVVIGASNEPDFDTIENRGWTVFTKDIISYSALRGRLDYQNSEFKMAKPKKANGSKKKK